jgi:predicted AAA+ superfamily ATPase
MDKSVLTTALVVSLAGIVALNIQHIFRFLSEHFVNAIFHSLKVDDSSPFYYAVQRYVKTEQKSRIKNFYYKNFWDNWLQSTDGQEKVDRYDNLFFSYGYFVVRFRKGYIFLSKTNETMTNSIDPWKNVKQSIRLYSFSRKNISDLVRHIEDNYYNNNIHYYFNSDGEMKMLGKVHGKTFDGIFLNDGLKEKIQSDVNRFCESKDLYRGLGIKYKRTYLFYGPAGTGKSSLATAIANYTHRNILSINISKDMTDSTLIKLIANRPNKSIILFEDIDCLFEDLSREQKKKKSDDNRIKITLSCILNILDGAYTPDDVIFILTTNHIEKLDPAIKRDGRTDMLLEITRPDADTRKMYIDYIKGKTGKDFHIDDTDESAISTLEKLIMQ